MKVRWLIVAMTLASTVAGGAKERVSLRVSPAFSFAPANLVIRASIEPDTQNRSIEVIADSPEFYRSSMIQLEGDRAPKTMIFEFRSVPPGDYQLTATVNGPAGQTRAVTRATVTVFEGGRAR